MSYPSEVIADNPRSYWRFGQQSSMYAYDVGSAANPLFLGAEGGNQQHTRVPDCFTGPVTGGVSVGCVNDLWGTWFGSSGPYQTPGTLEVLVWVVGGNVGGGGITAVMSTDRIAIGWDGFHFQGYVGTTPVTQAVAQARQVWHHVAFACDPTSCLLYVDGALVATHSLAIASTFDNRTRIGYFGANGAQMKMIFAEPAVYSTKLSAARVTAHFNAADNMSALPVKLAAAGSVGPPLSGRWQNAP